MNLRDEITQLGRGNVPRSAEPFDLSLVGKGDTVEVRTKTGSTFWLTRTRDSYEHGEFIYGISLVTNSKTFGQTTVNPAAMWVDKLIVTGRNFFVRGRPTSPVVSVQLV
jgi:hypothetical protein